MSALIKAAGFVDRLQWKHWDRLTFKPDEIQQRLLLKIIQRNRKARFGRDHGFSTIGSLRDYRKQVPLADYEGLRSYVDSVKAGEPDVLTAEPVVMFTMTSGSTGDPKLIPVTARARENHRQLTRLWYHRALADSDAAGLRAVVGTSTAERLAEAEKSDRGADFLRYLRDNHADTVEVTDALVRGDRALVLVAGERSYGKVVGEAILSRVDGAWRVDDEMLQIKME